MLTEFFHDLACWHNPPLERAIAVSLTRGGMLLALSRCAVGQDSHLTGGIFQDGPHVAQGTTAQAVTVLRYSGQCRQRAGSTAIYTHQPSTARDADSSAVRGHDADCLEP